MTSLDYGILAIILLSTIVGLQRGFVREVLSLFSLGVALAVALLFSEYIAPVFETYITVPSMRRVASFATLFFFMLIVMALLNRVLVSLVEQSGATGVDHFLGMLFGIARGVFIIAITVFLAGFTPFPKDPWWKETRLIGQFEEISKQGCQFMPAELKKYSSFCS